MILFELEEMGSYSRLDKPPASPHGVCTLLCTEEQSILSVSH